MEQGAVDAKKLRKAKLKPKKKRSTTLNIDESSSSDSEVKRESSTQIYNYYGNNAPAPILHRTNLFLLLQALLRWTIENSVPLQHKRNLVLRQIYAVVQVPTMPTRTNSFYKEWLKGESRSERRVQAYEEAFLAIENNYLTLKQLETLGVVAMALRLSHIYDSSSEQ